MRPVLDPRTLLVCVVFDLIAAAFIGAIYILLTGNHFSLDRREWACDEVVVNPPIGRYVFGDVRAAPPEDQPVCVHYRRRTFSEPDAHDQWSSARQTEMKVVALILLIFGVGLTACVTFVIRPSKGHDINDAP